MVKKAISVTLRPENLVWLRGQTRASSRRSISETLDALITEARAGGGGRPGTVRSVVGSIGLSPSDPGLARADASLRRLFTPSAAARRRPPARRHAAAGPV
jgi:hypothetical protein